MKARVRLFRGEYAGVWERRLIAKGYPKRYAYQLSRFLTYEGPLPDWNDLLLGLDADLAEPEAKVFVELPGNVQR